MYSRGVAETVVGGVEIVVGSAERLKVEVIVVVGNSFGDKATVVETVATSLVE